MYTYIRHLSLRDLRPLGFRCKFFYSIGAVTVKNEASSSSGTRKRVIESHFTRGLSSSLECHAVSHEENINK